MERQNNQSPTRQRVVSQVEDQNLANQGRNNVSMKGMGVFIALVLAGSLTLDALFSPQMPSYAEELPTPTPFVTVAPTPTIDPNYNYGGSVIIPVNPTATPTAAPTNVPVVTATPTPAPQVMNNTGNALNEQEVNQRVVVILQEFRNAGIINNETGVEYTFDEIKAILLYMNGAYVPEDENEAYTMHNKFLNMVCAPINTKKTLDIVNYMGGNTAISKEQIDANNAKYPTVNWMNFILGDSNCSGFLTWFNQQVMLMNSTSDKDVYNSTFEVVSQALANLCFGNGCVVNGHTYTLDDFMGLDDVNDGNLLQLLVYIYQVGRNQNVAQEYRITSGYSDATVSLDSILACFNPACTLTSSNVSINNDGLVVAEDGATFATVNQVNTINNALSNYYAQGLGRYDDIYQKTK